MKDREGRKMEARRRGGRGGKRKEEVRKEREKGRERRKRCYKGCRNLEIGGCLG